MDPGECADLATKSYSGFDMKYGFFVSPSTRINLPPLLSLPPSQIRLARLGKKILVKAMTEMYKTGKK